MKLPNGHLAELGDKLDEYVLNEDHPRGRHKARVFKSVLGITIGNSYLLQQSILDAVASSDEAVETGDHGFGMTYRLIFRMEGNGRSARVRLDLILKNRLKKCVDLSKIRLNNFVHAAIGVKRLMRRSKNSFKICGCRGSGY